MKNTFPNSKCSVDRFQAVKKFENAIVSCPEKLEKDEVNALTWRFGLFGRQGHDLSDLAIRMRKQIPEVEKLLHSSIRKCLNNPIKNLLKEAYSRVDRFSRLEKNEGYSDLKLAYNILKRADYLNDCRIAFHIETNC